VGGEIVKMAFSFGDTNTQGVASMIQVAGLTYRGGQAVAELYGTSNNCDNTLQTALPGVISGLPAHCQNASTQFGILYDPPDMISPTPFTPAQKQFLSQSKFYNSFSIHPPTSSCSM
jgi:hypothetical protein